MIRNCGELGPNLQKIVRKLLSNQNLLKLLYYTGNDPLSEPDLSDEIIKNEIYEKLIKFVPRVGPKETAQALISLRVVSGVTDSNNNQFRNIHLSLEIFTPLTQWVIKDANLRPFAIIGEIQTTLNGKKIDGLGKIMGGDFDLEFLTDEISAYEVAYDIVNYD